MCYLFIYLFLSLLELSVMHFVNLINFMSNNMHYFDVLLWSPAPLFYVLLYPKKGIPITTINTMNLKPPANIIFLDFDFFTPFGTLDFWLVFARTGHQLPPLLSFHIFLPLLQMTSDEMTLTKHQESRDTDIALSRRTFCCGCLPVLLYLLYFMIKTFFP